MHVERRKIPKVIRARRKAVEFWILLYSELNHFFYPFPRQKAGDWTKKHRSVFRVAKYGLVNLLRVLNSTQNTP